ncbi:MAG: 50S ribosome-binding GTPase, partial [Firmicutes bacterium]|nr:50S ribosome-binding GTPase [Bacillota bacterium]
MLIQWFPGHMTAALRMMQREIDLADGVVYMLDGRAPISCLNPKFEEVIKNKPIIYVVNKTDLSCEYKGLGLNTKDYNRKKYDEILKNAVRVNSVASGSTKPILNTAYELLKGKIEKAKEKGINKVLRLMVLGVPNSGKSTFINNMCGKAKALTGNKPGVTRGKQWVKVNEYFELLDTPGTLWPSFSNKQVALNL